MSNSRNLWIECSEMDEKIKDLQAWKSIIGIPGVSQQPYINHVNTRILDLHRQIHLMKKDIEICIDSVQKNEVELDAQGKRIEEIERFLDPSYRDSHSDRDSTSAAYGSDSDSSEGPTGGKKRSKRKSQRLKKKRSRKSKTSKRTRK